MGIQTTLTLKLNRVTALADRIASFEFVHPDREDLPAFSAGSHLSVQLPGGLERQYSLCNDPREVHRYVVAVQIDENSRGGSIAMHRDLAPGMLVRSSLPRNNFPLNEDAGSYLFIAGGIGITPIRGMIARVDQLRKPWRLLYCTRTPTQTAFMSELTELGSGRTVLHHSGADNSNLIDLAPWLDDPMDGEHLYCCGPTGLMKAVRSGSSGWRDGTVHFEWFAPENDPTPSSSNGSFEIELASSGQVLPVPSDKTILQVLLDAGVDCDFSCEEGTCGTCATKVLSGTPEHRDSIIPSDRNLEQQGLMMVCVSRSRDARLVLDL